MRPGARPSRGLHASTSMRGAGREHARGPTLAYGQSKAIREPLEISPDEPFDGSVGQSQCDRELPAPPDALEADVPIVYQEA